MLRRKVAAHRFQPPEVSGTMVSDRPYPQATQWSTLAPGVGARPKDPLVVVAVFAHTWDSVLVLRNRITVW